MTVVKGPLPAAGSLLKRVNSHGMIVAIRLALVTPMNMEIATMIDIWLF